MDGTNPSTHPRPDTSAPTYRLPHRLILGAALFVGVSGNILVQGSQGPGLNVPLFFATLVLAIGGTAQLAGRPPSREACAWIIGGMFLSTGLVLRASPTLQFLAFLSASAAFTFPALRAGAAWIRGSGVSDHIEAIVGAVGYAGFGAVHVAADVLSSHAGAPGEAGDSISRRAFAILRGLLLAAPLLFIFGVLFVSADRVFADLASGLLGTAIEEWGSHLAVTGILTWLATGYLTGFLTGTRLRGVVERGMGRPSVGIVEVAVALGLVALLVTTFIAVQARYLFGGTGLVEVTPGLTYSEYAREGFVQLALASALVLPILLISDWLLLGPSPRGRTIFRALGSLHLLLLVLIIASAFQRVRAYQDAYGLTESRFYGVVFLTWLALVSIWFGMTVLRGRRERFAFPALISALAVVAALFVANPDLWIARTNLARSGVVLGATAQDGAIAGAGEDSSGAASERPSIDAAYLASLSADAVPTLLRALPHLPPDSRCGLARGLMERWDTSPDPDWRSWNRAVVRARRAVRSQTAELRSMNGGTAGCPEG